MSIGDVFLLIVRWLHVTSAVLWVGGSLFYLLVLRPTLKRGSPGDGALSGALVLEFRSLVDTCIFVLILTGGILTFDRLTEGVVGVPYVSTLAAKIALALWMFYLALARRRTGRFTDPPRAIEPGMAFAWWRRLAQGLSGYNLIAILGVLVFLLADLLKVLFENALAEA